MLSTIMASGGKDFDEFQRNIAKDRNSTRQSGVSNEIAVPYNGGKQIDIGMPNLSIQRAPTPRPLDPHRVGFRPILSTVS